MDRRDFEGRVVIVTGGSRGIGRAIAEAFLRSGAEVVVCARNDPGSTGPPSWQDRSAVFVQADIRQAEEAKRLVDETTARFGRLDVLVNNAGGSPAVSAAVASPRFVRSVVELNLLAPFFCSQAANAVMQTQHTGGVILNIGSVSGTRPSPGTAAYGAAKAGLANLTSTLAVEWAPKVRVNCLVGGLIATETAESHYGGPQGMEAVAQTVPLGRFGTPEDIAGLCLLLASPLASYVSGAVLVAHGGGERPAYLTALDSLTPADFPDDSPDASSDDPPGASPGASPDAG
jgi:NAD(P)-dependent dehydrogenase (short-subunit alcohol dehydrogenase family)